MSIESLLVNHQNEINNIDNQINHHILQINKELLLKDAEFVQQFHIEHQIDETAEDDLKALTLSQLNEKYNQTEKRVEQLSTIKDINSKVIEIKAILKKPKSLSDLLDFQQLFGLFKSVRSELTLDSSVLIYKQLSKSLDLLYDDFLVQLNEYSIKLLPDELTINNISMLSDFYHMISKNDIKLDHFSYLKTKWDALIDSILGHNITLEAVVQLVEDELEYDVVSIKVQNISTTDITEVHFFKSLSNVITFINYIGVTSIKQFLNSKIDRLLIDKITSSISKINNDDRSFEDLRNLTELCHSTNWNILSRFDNSNNSSIKENLNKLYVDWLIESYVESIREVFLNSEIKPATDWVSAQSEHTTSQALAQDHKVSQETEPVPEIDDETDAWDDNWDDAWDEEDENNDVVQEKKSAPQSETTKVAQSPLESQGPSVRISSIPSQILPIFDELKSVSSEPTALINMVKALSISKYPPLSSSYLLYNDFKYLAQSLNSPQFESLLRSLENQSLIQLYNDLKVLIISLDLSMNDQRDSPSPSSTQEDENYGDDEFFELDDYNLNQLSLIYKWFNKLFQETDLKITNGPKFKQLVISLVEFVNTWLINTVFNLPEISEYQSKKISTIIESLDNVTVPFIIQIDEPKDNIKSYSKLNNVKFLVTNHLKDIMDRFYQGELFDITTEELIKIIRCIFVRSELRDGYINEIIEFRTMN